MDQPAKPKAPRRRAKIERASDALMTDPQGASLLNMGPTKFAELQQEPDFPRPVWLGPRTKRHVRDELIAYALGRRERPSQ